MWSLVNFVVGQKMANNRMHSDSQKRRSYLALLLAAGDARRYTAKIIQC